MEDKYKYANFPAYIKERNEFERKFFKDQQKRIDALDDKSHANICRLIEAESRYVKAVDDQIGQKHGLPPKLWCKKEKSYV